MRRPFLIALFPLILVFGCSKDEIGEDPNATELFYYKSAQDSLRASNYAGAIQKLQMLESRFPFGRYAEQAQLEIIYAFFKSSQPEAAKSAADRFIRLHPSHPSVDYAYYLKGMVSFEQDKNFLANIIPMDPSTRDPGAARQSFNDFSELLRLFPDSEYAPDAQSKMKYLRNLLAQSEIRVAEYYIERGAYVAAVNRGRYVLENFQGSVAVPDGLAIMVEAYKMMDMEDLAAKTLKVLVSNYPEHGSLDKNGNFKKTVNKGGGKTRNWLRTLTLGVFG